MRKYLYVSLALSLLFIPVFSLAQQDNDTSTDDSAPVASTIAVPSPRGTSSPVEKEPARTRRDPAIIKKRLELHNKNASPVLRDRLERTDALRAKDVERKVEVRGVKSLEERRQLIKLRHMKARERLEERRKLFEKDAEKRKEILKKKLGALRAERIERFFKQMAGRFTRILERFNWIADKLEYRLDLFEKEKGFDVSVPREKLAVARQKIEDAENTLEQAKQRYREALESEDMRASFAKVRGVVKDLVLKIREAHKALVEVVKSIKGIAHKKKGGGDEGSEGQTATTTPEE